MGLPNGALNGGRGETTSEPQRPQSNKLLAHDIITFAPKSKEKTYLTCAPLYEKGLSLGEISKQTGIAKTSIREAFLAYGFSTRKFAQGKNNGKTKPQVMKPGVIPYGYAYLEGKLVISPNEYKIVLSILREWKSGKSFKAIARLLNAKKVRTRLGKTWVGSTIAAIARREIKNDQSTKA